jgi:hypothetical protein
LVEELAEVKRGLRRRQRARRRCEKERLQSADLFVAWTLQV